MIKQCPYSKNANAIAYAYAIAYANDLKMLINPSIISYE